MRFPERAGCDKLASTASSQPEPRRADHDIPILAGLNAIQEEFVLSSATAAAAALVLGPGYDVV